MTILDDLKSHTRTRHDALEKDLDLLRENFSINEYVEVLKKFYGFYRPLEKKLNLDPERLKLPKLESDLNFFRVSVSDIADCDKLPSVETDSHVMGVKYVLEGSTLGGMILTNHYKEKFNLSSDHGVSFFSGYGAETLSKWKSFQNELLIFSESKSFNRSHVIHSASDTFHILHCWLINP